MAWAISAKVAPLPAPSAAAIVRNTAVWNASSGGVPDTIAAQTATTANTVVSTGIGPIRSESQPPTGRITTATTTKPAIRFAASAGVRSCAVLRYAGRYTENAT